MSAAIQGSTVLLTLNWNIVTDYISLCGSEKKKWKWPIFNPEVMPFNSELFEIQLLIPKPVQNIPKYGLIFGVYVLK